jgi:hypothetical protein
MYKPVQAAQSGVDFVAMAIGKKSILLFAALTLCSAHAAEPDTEGWLFLGRRSAENWKPASTSIVNARYPVKPGNRVVVARDALLYGTVDCKVVDAADFKAGDPPRPVLRIKADAEGLEIVGSPLECPSVGRAKTVWAKVRIPTARLVSAEK